MPPFSVLDVLETHEQNRRVKKLDNIAALKILLPIEEKEYVSLAHANMLNCINRPVGTTYDQLEKFYNGKFVQNKDLRTNYYEKLKQSLPDNICPYCMMNAGEPNLDHFLPKSDFKQYAVTPVNLVPSCVNCNTKKLASNESAVHPYFHDFSSTRWLYAKMISVSPFEVKFYCNFQNSQFNQEQMNLIKSHFKVFNLSKRFSSKVGSEIANYRFMFTTFLEKQSPIELKKRISEMYSTSYHYNKNSWKTALYDLLLTLEEDYDKIIAV